jgi:hypothetical protein
MGSNKSEFYIRETIILFWLDYGPSLAAILSRYP